MNRKAAALAVGALFLAPAAHAQIVFGNPQVGTLQLYGKLYPQFQYGTSKDATPTGGSVSTMASVSGICGTSGSTGGCTGNTPGPRKAIDVQNSYLGFRGERDISGRGLKFIWQLEQAVGFDFDSPEDNVFSNRNSFLGVRSGWGTVKLGNMDTIYKEYGDPMSMFGISSGNFVSASNVLSQIGVGNSSSASFHLRKANSIQYETPTFAGITFGYQYSPDEKRDTTNASGTCTTGATTANSTCGRDASLHSYGVKWDSEKLYLSVHQEVHNDFFGGSNNLGAATLSNAATQGAHSQDMGTRFSAEWRYLQDQRVTVDVARLRYREFGQVVAGRFERYTHNTWAIGWDGGFGGPFRFAAQYVQGNEGSCELTGGVSCSTKGLTGKMLNLGVRYRFDRQTFVYAIAGKLWNGPSARYDNWAASDPARGADILQTALGLSYSF